MLHFHLLHRQFSFTNYNINHPKRILIKCTRCAKYTRAFKRRQKLSCAGIQFHSTISMKPDYYRLARTVPTRTRARAKYTLLS